MKLEEYLPYLLIAGAIGLAILLSRRKVVEKQVEITSIEIARV